MSKVYKNTKIFYEVIYATSYVHIILKPITFNNNYSTNNKTF